MKSKYQETGKRESIEVNLAVSILFCLITLGMIFLQLGCAQKTKESVSHPAPSTDFSGVLTIVNVENPSQPKLVSSTALPLDVELYKSIAIWMQYLIVTHSKGVHILDVKDILNPRLLWSLSCEMTLEKVAVMEDYAFFPTEKGLYILQMKNQSNPQWVFHPGQKRILNSYLTSLIDLKINGGYANVLDRYRYLHVLNLSEPAVPELVASHTVPAAPFYLFQVSGQNAHLLQIPAHPALDTVSGIPAATLLPRGLRVNSLEEFFDQRHVIGLNPSLLKLHFSMSHICWLFPYETRYLPTIFNEHNRLYFPDIDLAQLEYLYIFQKKRLHRKGDVTQVFRVSENHYHFISRDRWSKTFEIFQEELGGDITDFQLSENCVYISRGRGVLFIAELVGKELKGTGLLENLPEKPRGLTLNANHLFILGKSSQLE